MWKSVRKNLNEGHARTEKRRNMPIFAPKNAKRRHNVPHFFFRLSNPDIHIRAVKSLWRADSVFHTPNFHTESFVPSPATSFSIVLMSEARAASVRRRFSTASHDAIIVV